ncbi:MAG: PAS domain-containing protein, partial [Planctomycetes bacterium]|nr:PAS domain-containing protein [Planctomycetota bacterium]
MRTIAAKTLVLTFLVFAASISYLAYSDYLQAKAQLEREYQAKKERIAKHFESVLYIKPEGTAPEDPINEQVSDISLLMGRIRTELSDKDLAAAVLSEVGDHPPVGVVLDENDELVPYDAAQHAAMLGEIEDSLVIRIDHNSSVRAAGAITVYFSGEGFHARVARARLFAVLKAVMTAFGAAIVLWWVLRSIVFRPLDALRENASQPSRGGNWSNPFDEERNDEIGQVAHAFDSAVHELQTLLAKERGLVQQVRQQGQEYSSLVASIPGAIYRCRFDEHWTMEVVSEQIQEITGYPSQDFLGEAPARTYASLLHPDDKESVIKEIKEAREANRSFSVEYRIIHADGSERWVHERGRVNLENLVEGSATIDGMIFDISERKRFE